MEKGDEVYVVVVVEIKLVLAEQFSDEFQIVLSRNHHHIEVISKFTTCTSYLQPNSSGAYL